MQLPTSRDVLQYKQQHPPTKPAPKIDHQHPPNPVLKIDLRTPLTNPDLNIEHQTTANQNTYPANEKLGRFMYKMGISCHTREGVPEFLTLLERRVSDFFQSNSTDEPVLTRLRHRELLSKCVVALQNYLDNEKDIVLASEELRASVNYLGAIMGKISVEQILDVIFSDFCIGK